MFKPEDPLAPPRPAFSEPWHAQVLALAGTLVKSGHFSAGDWADALGAALAAAERCGAPDTDDTYYTCALSALETLSAAQAGISAPEQAARKRAWEDAYRRTPHGRPVRL